METSVKNSFSEAFDLLGSMIDDYYRVKTECIQQSIAIAIRKTMTVLNDNINMILNSQVENESQLSTNSTQSLESESTDDKNHSN